MAVLYKVSNKHNKEGKVHYRPNRIIQRHDLALRDDLSTTAVCVSTLYLPDSAEDILDFDI